MSSTPAKIICRKCRLEYPGDALFCPNCGTARVGDDAGDPLLGTTIAERYVLLERIGHGASGTIYRAEHITLRRRVAVKVLHHELSRDDLAIERFRREATTVGQIENEHIVEIFDFGRTTDGRLYLAMELLEGETLADLIEREGQLEVERAVDILVQLGETLMEAHAMGYIHRDLRPRNVFLAVRRGKSRKGFVKLLDFGLAKLVEKEGEAASTSLGMTFGDPHYMSPEQARGDALDRRADIYSLGCITYEMLVGEPPFVGGKVFDVLTRHVERMPVEPQARRSDVPTWLNHAVMRMLAKRADQRFITVFRLIDALRQGSDSGHIMADEVAWRPETIPPTSVTQAMAKLGARAPADLVPELPRVPPADTAAGAIEAEPEPAASDEPESSPDVGNRGVGAVTVLGVGVAGGKRAQLIQAAARASQAAAAAQPAAARKNGSSVGLSAAWYADGEAMNGDAEGAPEQAARAETPRRKSPSNTDLLILEDDEYIEPRRGRWKVAAIVGGVLALGAAGAFALVSRGGSEATSASAQKIEASEAKEAKAAGPGKGETLVAATPPPAPVASEAPAVESPAPAANPAASGEPDAKVSKAEPAPAAKKVEKKVARAERAGDADASTDRRRKSTGRSAERRSAEDGERAEERESDEALRIPALRPTPRDGGADAGKAEFYARMGERDLANGDFLGAATNFNKARALDANNATAILGLGEIALSQGSTDAAIAHLRRAAKLRPRDARAHTLLGEALLAAGRNQQAAASFRRALKIDPGDSRAQGGLEEAGGSPAEGELE